MTVKELAKLANVSTATISLVLNKKEGVSDKKRREIEKLIAKTGYTLRQAPTKKKNKNLCFLKVLKSGYFVEQNAGFVSKIMDSVQTECSNFGYNLNIVVAKNDFSKALMEINGGNYDGVFVIGTELDRDDFKYLDILTLPYIVIDNSMPVYQCNSITMNNEEMVYTVLKHLATLNDPDFGYLHGLPEAVNFIERKNAVFTYAKEFNFDFNDDKMFLIDANVSGSYESMLKIIRSGKRIPRILFADNDIVAIGAMKALLESGYKIPDDIKIAGFDDIYLSSIASVPLTTMHVQRKMIGEIAAQTLINHISNRFKSYSKIKIGGTLKVRKTTSLF